MLLVQSTGNNHGYLTNKEENQGDSDSPSSSSLGRESILSSMPSLVSTESEDPFPSWIAALERERRRDLRGVEEQLNDGVKGIFESKG